MLLETLDILKNDVIIYSENRFDFQENFKLIFKRENDKSPREIDYFEVCKFIRDPVPKNLIVYRLLTNVKKLNAYSTKYGYFINSGNGFELVYFDPIFALKDIPNLDFDLDPEKFRFKIQQTGFSGVDSKNDEAFYKEVYSFDLRAVEAQNQNDRIFVEAIFALDDSFSSSGFNKSRITMSNTDSAIEEDASQDLDFNKADFELSGDGLNYNEQNIEKLKRSFKSEWNDDYKAYNQFKLKSEKSKDDKKKVSFSQFIDEHRSSGKKDETEKTNDILGSASQIQKGRDDSVILRFRE